MSGSKRGSKVERDAAVTAGLDDLIASTAEADSEFRAAAEDTDARLDLLQQLVNIRHERKLSQTAVARLMQTGQSAVSELEKGIVEPRLSTLQRYARVLGYRLWIFPVRRPSAVYTDRKFPYPTAVPVRIRSARAVPDPEHGGLEPGKTHVTRLGNVVHVQFHRRENSPLGGSIADRLNHVSAA
jgi:transcriptional regulator with XRE-family HTH domain